MKKRQNRKHSFYFFTITFLAALFISCCIAQKTFAAEDSTTIAAAEEALFLAEKYVDAHPDDPEALLQLGISYMRLGRHSESMNELQEAADIDPDDPYIQVWIGRAYAETGRPEMAREFAEKAMDMDPEDRVLNEFAGAVFFETGDFEKAEEIAYALTGDDMFYTSRNGSEVLLLFLSRMMLGDEAGMDEILDRISIVSKQAMDCVKVLLADAMIGLGGEWLEKADKILTEKFGGCGACGEVEFRKAYLAYLMGDYEAAETAFMGSVTTACSGEEYRQGREQGELMAVMASFEKGTTAGELLDWLYGIEGVEASPYAYWIESLLLNEEESDDIAPDAMMEGTLILPVDFGASEPGPYSIFSKVDYERLNKILYQASGNLDTFTVSCGGELPVSMGTFFTSLEKPGIENLFRYSEVTEDEKGCVFEIFSAKTVKIDSRLKEEHLLLPLTFSEEFYFLKNIYPSAMIFETAWYINITDLFPGLVKETN